MAMSVRPCPGCSAVPAGIADAGLREQYRADIDLVKLASNLHVDAVVPGDELRAELVRRLAVLQTKVDRGPERRRAVLPV